MNSEMYFFIFANISKYIGSYFKFILTFELSISCPFERNSNKKLTMKKSIINLLNMSAFALLFVFASCNEAVKSDTEAKKEETPKVELKIETPQPSPFSKIEQKIGLTDVTVEFSRPGMRGRTVFGDLVPYGKTWRTGANANTKITFSTDVVVDGQTLKAGSYAVYTIPNKESWDVMFYSDSNNWGNQKEWDDSKVAAKTKVDVMKMPMKIETFTITFDDLAGDSAVMGILWENTYAGVKFEVPQKIWF